jgi:cell division transport system permease protein
MGASTSFRRIFKSGFLSFWRNRWISSATIGIMIIALGLVTGLFVASAMADAIFTSLEEQVDITVYFNLDTSEEDILSVRDELEELPEVSFVEYVSREQALAEFRARHGENALITQSLDELGDNPLEASLNIKAQDISQYEPIAAFLESARFTNFIDTVNYRENQLVIERLSSIIDIARRTGIVLALALLIIAVLVTFNTIRLTIYSLREEIGVMRLVGASNWYIRGPFVIEGVLYGLIASVVALILFIPLVRFSSPRLVGFLPGITLSDYFFANLGEIFLLQTLLGVILGVISSLIAMRRYLQI